MASNLVSPRFSLLRSLPPLQTILTFAALIFLAWAFFTKLSMTFYASILFSFYSLTHSMWVSVVLLGVFQTILMIPLRIVNITKTKHIKEFEEKIIDLKAENEQSFLIKKSAKSGNRVFLYYVFEFFVQLTSFLSIGRLFLTDFYSKKLDPNLLFSFAPYPNYPLQDVWFKIPYLNVIETKDLGFTAWLIVTLIIIAIAMVAIKIQHNIDSQTKEEQDKISAPIHTIVGLFTGSALILIMIAYYVVGHFPEVVEIAIFTGDVGKPNPSFNTLTAIVTFITIVWLDMPAIFNKGKLAKKSGIEESIVHRTQIQLFGETLRSATIIGLGAYFITNQIPCAFELSIFTLEVISWLSPITIDRWILNTGARPKPATVSPPESA